jgi:hypothetical protein
VNDVFRDRSEPYLKVLDAWTQDILHRLKQSPGASSWGASVRMLSFGGYDRYERHAPGPMHPSSKAPRHTTYSAHSMVDLSASNNNIARRVARSEVKYPGREYDTVENLPMEVIERSLL